MGPDFYQVQILHYLNPHLIWVEVLKGDENYVFEQVGIYGLLPLDASIDIELTLHTQRSDEWMPAAVVLMKKFLFEAEEVWFQSTYIDRRSSIFDNNIHKFGDIIIKKSNGKQKSLTTFLADSGFALHNEALFHQELSLGKVKTKLDRVKTQEVIKQLSSFYEKNETAKLYKKSFEDQTSVVHTAKELESILTVRNLNKHNRESREQIIENKLKDLEWCKGIDEQSVGRGTSSHSLSVKQSQSKLLERKLIAKVNNVQSEVDIFIATKKYLEANASANKEEYSEGAKSDYDSSYHSLFPNKQQSTAKVSDTAEKAKSNDTKNQTIEPQNLAPTLTVRTPVKWTGKRRTKTKSPKIPEYDMKKEKRVAYGPPNVDRTKLKYEIVPKTIVDDEIEIPPKVTTHVTEFDEQVPERDIFDDVDSDIHLGISNLDVLKKIKVDHEFMTKAHEKPDLDIDSKIYKKADKSKLRKHVKEVSDLSETDHRYAPDVNKKVAMKEKSVKIHQIIMKADENNKKENFNDLSETDNRSASEITENVAKKEVSVKTDQLTSNAEKTDVDKRKDIDKGNTTSKSTRRGLLLQRYRNVKRQYSTSNSDTTNKDTSSEGIFKRDDSDTESISSILDQVNNTSDYISPKKDEPDDIAYVETLKANVNPFKNLETSKSVFVEKLVSPVLLVHTKKNNCIKPSCELQHLPFGSNIHVALKNLNVSKPTRIQTVSWPTILRGHSVFIISPLNSGKTMGYLPAVCKLVTDVEKSECTGPICIIICATTTSVSEVERLARMFVGLDEKVLALYAGMDELTITTSLLNGCDILICTAPMLVRLLQMELRVDLKRLATFVLDDCERLSTAYMKEIKVCLYKIKELLKSRANKELKVQFVVSSRIWCTFMEPFALKAPDTVVCIGSFQECVLYSKANTTVKFVMKENKIKTVVEFLKDIDKSKKTVIVCRDDAEVELIDKALTSLKYVVFACNDTMTLHDLYNLNVALSDYQEPLLGPILVCCDGNLTHLNVTDAHYLIHFSMPLLFSQFCKRFSVLNDSYASIFKSGSENVKINILLENSNVEQLPKILNFVSRCGYTIPEKLNAICKDILAQRDVIKAEKLVPICDNLLAFGECPNFWNCDARHSVIREFDNPRDRVPKQGVITFKILHYHNAVSYSAQLLSNVVDGEVHKYPQTYRVLSFKMGIYYSKLSNQRLHGEPKVGDICAVSLKINFHVRCQVIKILSHYPRGNPNYVLINLLDEEKLEKTRDIYLYHLPDELKNIDSHVVQVRLANIQPQDKDITYTEMAKDVLKKVTDSDDEMYVRGKIALTIGNCVFVDTLEACQDLSSMNETVVKYNFKKNLLTGHAIPKPDHIQILKGMCKDIDVEEEDSSEDDLNDLDEKLTHKDIKNAVGIETQKTQNGNNTDSSQKSEVEDSLILTDKLIQVQSKDLSADENESNDIANKDEVTVEQKSSEELSEVSEALENNEHLIGDTDIRIKGNMSDLDSVSENEAELIQSLNVTSSADDANDSKTADSELEVAETEIDKGIDVEDEIKKQKDTKTDSDEVNTELSRKESINYVQIDIDSETQSIKTGEKRNKKLKKICKKTTVAKPLVEPSWAYLDSDDFCEVFFSTAESPSKFFVRMSKFEQCIKYLLEDIKKHVEVNPDSVKSVQKGDFVLAKFPDDATFERARIDEIINENKSKCFFVDQGDWRDVPVKDLLPITEYIVKKIPFQAIECRLLGVKPATTEWTEFCTNWFYDKCLGHHMKYLYMKYLTKETAECTGGYKYGVMIVDTNSDKDVILNKLIVEANFADENHEMELVNSVTKYRTRDESKDSSDVEDTNSTVTCNKVPSGVLLGQPLRSVPLFDNMSGVEWDVCMSDDDLAHSIANNLKALPTPSLDKAKITDVIEENKVEVKETNAIKNIEVRNDIKTQPIEKLCKPKLVWRQTKSTVAIKIHLIGAENYSLKIADRTIDFSADLNDVKYGFKLNLYGVIDSEISKHSYKGLYILVSLVKVLQINWLALTSDDGVKKWIVYDVDSIDLSTDEEREPDDSILEIIKKNHNAASESDDDDFHDDTAL